MRNFWLKLMVAVDEATSDDVRERLTVGE